MPTYSDFLQLTLPAFGEFLNNWNEPMNQNFEDIDDHLADLRKALTTGAAGAPATSAYGNLVGSMYNLAARLNVSINADGTLNIANSPTIIALGSSATNGDDYNGDSNPDNDPRARFDYADLEIWNARSPRYGDRFSTSPTAKGLLDVGMAHRVRDAGMDLGQAISSPSRPPVSGLIRGSDSFLVGLAANQVKFDATVGTPDSWPVFNIDGFLFRIRDAITLDLSVDSAGTALANGDIVYLYVERINYDNANTSLKLASDPGATSAQDLRVIQSGSDGVISGKTFSSAGASFQGSTSKRQALPGDLLVIESGSAKGSYVLKSVDSQTQVTILGTFKADALTGQSWHIQDDAHPNIGAIKVADANTDPTHLTGRVYVGRGQLDVGGFRAVGGAPSTKIAFPVGGIYDSGWINGVNTGSFPLTLEHNLGCLPSSVEVYVRDSATGEAYRPMVLRTFVVDFDVSNTTVENTDPKKATLQVPSMTWKCTRQSVTLRLSFEAPNAAAYLFSKDDDSTFVTSGQVRVVARR